MTRIAVCQMTSGVDPAANARTLVEAARKAAEGGAEMLFTPEMAGLLDRDRRRAAANIFTEEADPVLAEMRSAAARFGVWIALGSLAVAREDGEGGGLWANRSFIIDAHGKIVVRYDKIHMFDVELESGESWRESAAYAPGEAVVTAETPAGRLGMTVCYDIRFPALFEELGRRHCDLIAIPAAFTVPTGKAHWHLLQRARAVEASAFVVSAAQVGLHEDGRRTYGHSLVVDPWGEIVLDMGGEAPGLAFCELDRSRIAAVRAQLPSLANRRPIPTSDRK